jgi:hypothetical protein
MNMRVCKVAFKQGQEAAANGWERVSPYSKLKAEQYWYNGYDSITKEGSATPVESTYYNIECGSIWPRSLLFMAC